MMNISQNYNFGNRLAEAFQTADNSNSNNNNSMPACVFDQNCGARTNKVSSSNHDYDGGGGGDGGGAVENDSAANIKNDRLN